MIIIKKSICLILFLVMMLFSGCTDKNNPATIPDASSPENTITPETSPSQPSVKTSIFTLSDDRTAIKKYSTTGELMQTYPATGVEMIASAIVDYSNGIVYYTGHSPESAPAKNIFMLFTMDVSSDQKKPVALVKGIEGNIYMRDGNLYYWVNGDGIYKYDTKTRNTARIASITNRIYDYIINGNLLYYSVFEYEKRELSGLYAYRLANNANEKLVSRDMIEIVGLIGDNCVYSYNDKGQDLLYHYDQITSKPALIPSKAKYSVIYGDKILYANPEDNDYIYQMDLSGGNGTPLIVKRGSSLRISNGWLYFVPNYSDYKNYSRYSLETGEVETLPETFSGEVIRSSE